MTLLGLVALLTLALAACGASAPSGAPDAGTAGASPNAATQTIEGGQVTVSVTWQGPGVGPVFDVAMETHSVDLDSYDLRQMAVLRIDGGQDARPSSWDAPKGGHHRSGTLSFPESGADGRALIGPDTREVVLIVRDVAGVGERAYRWTL